VQFLKERGLELAEEKTRIVHIVVCRAIWDRRPTVIGTGNLRKIL